MPTELSNTVAQEITRAFRGCHTQFRYQTEAGPRVVHGVLEDYSIGLKNVLVSLKYSTGATEDFVLQPNEGVTFVVRYDGAENEDAGADHGDNPELPV